MTKNRDFIKKGILSSLVPIIFILVWIYYGNRLNNPLILPKLGKVTSNFANANDNFIGLGSIPRNILVSLIRVMMGYMIAIMVALPLGVLMGYKRNVYYLFNNFINMFRPVPPLGWIPLILAWFGIASVSTILRMDYGPTQVFFNNFKVSMIFIIAIGAFFPVLTSSTFGVKTVPKPYIDSAKMLGASEKDIFFKILIPGAAPTIINGLRTGLGTAWGCLVAAEMLPGSLSGVGYMITHAYQLARIDLVITGIICIGVVGALLDYVFIILERTKFSWPEKMK